MDNFESMTDANLEQDTQSVYEALLANDIVTAVELSCLILDSRAEKIATELEKYEIKFVHESVEVQGEGWLSVFYNPDFFSSASAHAYINNIAKKENVY